MSAEILLHHALISYCNWLLTFGLLILSEQKIDRIETRLENIETLLRNSPHRPIPVPESSTTQYRSALSSTVNAGTTYTPDFGTPDAGSVFGSNSVITQQTSFANELIEDVMQRNSLRDIDPRMSEALANLRQIMEVQRQSPITYGPRFPLQRSLPPGGLRQLEMPPIDVVVPLLRGMKCMTNGSQVVLMLTYSQRLHQASLHSYVTSLQSRTFQTSAARFISPQKNILMQSLLSLILDYITCSSSANLMGTICISIQLGSTWKLPSQT